MEQFSVNTVFNVYLKGLDKTVSIDLRDFPASVVADTIEYGFRQRLADGYALPKSAKPEDKEAAFAERLERMKSGDLGKREVSSGGFSGVEAIAFRIALAQVKVTAKKQKLDITEEQAEGLAKKVMLQPAIKAKAESDFALKSLSMDLTAELSSL